MQKQIIFSRTFAIATLLILLATAGVASAQEASPAATPAGAPVIVGPSTCSVEPRADADALVSATPTERVQLESEADLPQGEPASQEMTDIVVAIERKLAACINDGDVLRTAALLTDEAAAQFLMDFDFANLDATPDSSSNGALITLVAASDIRVLEDGRLGAVVIWAIEGPGAVASEPPDLEANFHIYEEVDGEWLLAEELSGFIREMRVVPAAGGGWELDPDVLGTPYVYEAEGTPAA